MPVASLLALMLMAGDPAPADQVVTTAPPAVAPTVPDARPAASSGEDDIPPGAPTDDYGLVGWCYGALGEYLTIYDDIKPDLKAIDKMFGSPVVEAEPYHEDMAQLRLAEKRFGAAMTAAEKASPDPIAPRGAEAIEKGRGIWAIARLKSRRNLVDAWLFWGVPNRCETTSKSLKNRATLLGQAMAVSAPPADAPAKSPTPPAKPSDEPASAPDAPAATTPPKPN